MGKWRRSQSKLTGRTGRSEQETSTVPCIDTVFGKFAASSRRRLDLNYDSEALQLRFALALARRVDCHHFLDIGANVGVYAIAAGSFTSAESISSFEPTPESYAELEKSIRLQTDTDRHHTYNLALSDEQGHAEFFTYGDMAGDNSLHKTAGRNAQDRIEIALARLDDIVRDRGSTVFTKIDVEGHELAVLRGARELLDNNECFLQIEFLEKDTLQQGQSALAELGYEEVLHLRNDYYFIPRSRTDIREWMLERVFSDLESQLSELRVLREDRRIVQRQIRALKRNSSLLWRPLTEPDPQYFEGVSD